MGCGSSVVKINGDNSKEIPSTDKKNDKIDERTIQQLSTEDSREANSTEYQRKVDKLEDEEINEAKQENDNEADGNLDNISKHLKKENDQENSIKEIEKESEKLSQSDVCGEYSAIDAHARKAPSSVCNSVDDLVEYMLSFSKEPKILVRGFFVWIAENIRYDDAGRLNAKQRAPCDTASVMKNRVCVCEGYTHLLAALCSKANIPAVKIIGYVKNGEENVNIIMRPLDKMYFTMKMPDHGWNAVQLNGNWYFIDNTMGAGEKMNDFYFLAEPKHIISTHFPYQVFDENARFGIDPAAHMCCLDAICERSKKWQLLSEPITLEQFGKNVRYTSEAFKIGVEAVSHPHWHIEMENEIEMQFKTTKPEGIFLSSYIMELNGNMFQGQPNATFEVHCDGIVTILVHPRATGYYVLKIIGKFCRDDSKQGAEEIMSYYINCTQVMDAKFEFPRTFEATAKEKVVLHEPRRGNLIEDSTVHFRFSAPYLQRIRVGESYLNKEADLFTGDVTIKSAHQLIVSGLQGDGELEKILYIFKICKKEQPQSRQKIVPKNRHNKRRTR